MPPSSKRFILQSYELGSFDSNFCLKPPLMLWVVLLYLARAFVIPFISGVSSMGGSGDASAATRGYFSVEDFVSSALALIVLVTYFRRTPTASELWRRLWGYGRIILAAAAVVDLGVSAFRFSQVAGSEQWHAQLLLLACCVDAYILVYLFRSRRVRDVFNDFPSPQ